MAAFGWAVACGLAAGPVSTGAASVAGGLVGTTGAAWSEGMSGAVCAQDESAWKTVTAIKLANIALRADE